MNAKKVYKLAKDIERADRELSDAEAKVVKLRLRKQRLNMSLMSEIGGTDDEDPADDEVTS